MRWVSRPYRNPAPNSRATPAEEDQQQQKQVPIGAAPSDRRHEAAHHQGQPDQQTGEDHDLPRTAHVEELVALVPEPVHQIGVGHASAERQPFAGQGADHRDHQSDPQRVHAQPLQRRLEACDERGEIEACAQPRGGDPENRELNVPGSSQGVGRDVGQGNAVEVVPFHRVVCGDRAEHDLDPEQQRDDPDVLDDTAHRCRGHRPEQRIAVGNAGGRLGILQPLLTFAQEEPAQGADAGDQEYHGDEGPDEGGSARPVADQRLVRPVVGIGHGIVRAERARGPGGPPPPCDELSHRGFRRCTERLVRDGEGGPQGFGLGTVARPAEQGQIVLDDGLQRLGALARDHDGSGLGVVGVDADAGRELGDAGGAFGLGQGGEIAAGVQHRHGFPVQHVGGPVRRKVAAVPPHRAKLHAAQAAPCVAPVVDVTACEQDGARVAVGDDDPLRQGRRLLERASSHVQQHCEHDDEEETEQGPKPRDGEDLAIVHDRLPWASASVSASSASGGRRVQHLGNFHQRLRLGGDRGRRPLRGKRRRIVRHVFDEAGDIPGLH